MARNERTRLGAMLCAGLVPASVATVPPAGADPNQFPSLSDYAAVDAAGYQTYSRYMTSGLQFETPGGYRCRMSFTHKQNGAHMECWGTLPGTANNHVGLNYLSGANVVDVAFSNIDLSKMEVVEPGPGVTGGPINPRDYKPLPPRSKLVYDDGPLQTCGVDASMTACELVDGDRQHGFVLSPQGSWTF
ncbi:hypothetical protein MRAB57_4358 [Mycobacterium rhizamassiliense]|jgi:hypothetical protein|uniref:Secreted protein n=1 Tax=Mycobacterium rhizamassiliense TaxID=1841860 RepID=A0A2U3NYC4_9MYCO|nr:hypothetical protein [Mycobacterium rhizamassiliense]SPM36517.1 hypothetical protein MRAB57_4358 [Mycobacterium rhizamassiliense]